MEGISKYRLPARNLHLFDSNVYRIQCKVEIGRAHV